MRSTRARLAISFWIAGALTLAPTPALAKSPLQICLVRWVKIQLASLQGKDVRNIVQPTTYPDGTVVSPVFYEDGKFGAVKIETPGRKPVTFERMNRHLREYSVPDPILESLQGKVADLGTGDGQTVFDLRARGVEAQGYDILLNEYQKTKRFFHQADMGKTGAPDEFYDAVITNLTVYSYLSTRKGEPHYDQGLAVMRELLRITKPGGRVIIGGAHYLEVRDILAELGNAKIVAPNLDSVENYVVIRKNPVSP